MEFVRYIGPSHTRVITADEWAAAGVPDMGSVEWSAVNGFSVPLERFTEKALQVAIYPDEGLVIVEGEQHAPHYIGAAGTLTPEQAAGVGRVDVGAALGVNRVPAWLSGPSTTALPAAPTTVTTGKGSGSD